MDSRQVGRNEMNAADFENVGDAEKEHSYQCSKCGEFVDKRELRDVIFHESGHDPQANALPRIIGKPFMRRILPRLRPAMQ